MEHSSIKLIVPGHRPGQLGAIVRDNWPRTISRTGFFRTIRNEHTVKNEHMYRSRLGPTKQTNVYFREESRQTDMSAQHVTTNSYLGLKIHDKTHRLAQKFMANSYIGSNIHDKLTLLLKNSRQARILAQKIKTNSYCCSKFHGN